MTMNESSPVRRWCAPSLYSRLTRTGAVVLCKRTLFCLALPGNQSKRQLSDSSRLRDRPFRQFLQPRRYLLHLVANQELPGSEVAKVVDRSRPLLRGLVFLVHPIIRVEHVALDLQYHLETI